MQANAIYKNNIKNQPFDAVIVPGIPFNGHQWDDVMKMRVVWAVYLYNEGITKNIIFSGSAVYTPFIESKIMKQYAVALGVDSNNIFVETKAEHSSENVYFSYLLARENALTNVAVATDLVQTKMVKKFVAKKKIPVSYLPAKISIIQDIVVPDSISIDTMEAYVPNFTSIEETQTQQYRWRGTQGKNIDFRKYK
jgi:uncharacterized SAM-binding protein YcdF (DUF218 family)